jgi:hypothetical protein
VPRALDTLAQLTKMILTKNLFRPSSPLKKQPFMERQGAAMKFQYGNGQSPLEGYVILRGIGIGGFGATRSP